MRARGNRHSPGVANRISCGDCLDLLGEVPEASIDLILCDLPYGKTRNEWDQVIPLEPLWKHYRRIIKERGAVILTGQGMFSARLIMSAPKLYRYTLIWKKNKPRGFLNAKRQPLRSHEDILVFYKKQPTYHPQKTTGHPPVHSYTKHGRDGNSGRNYGPAQAGWQGGGSTERYPTSVIEIPVVNETAATHPTEKPTKLGEWLIRTYTNPGELVLDNACGSGSFLVAAKNIGRQFIGMELSPAYTSIARNRTA